MYAARNMFSRMASSSLMRALDNQDRQETARILTTMPSEVSIRDSEDRVALHYAAETMDLDTFRAIYNEDPLLVDCQDKNGHTPLLMAVMGGRTELVEFLLEKGANMKHVDKDGHSAVHWAVVCGQLETLTFLLEKGADTTVPDLLKAHPLHYATAVEEVSHDTAISILHTLLRKGAHVNCLDIDERTPILWAASNGNVEALMSLKQAGGDIQAVDRDRLGVFHCAASHGYHEVIEMVLQCVPRNLVDLKDRSGHTPLFYAVSHGHFEAARMLLAAGANPNHQDSRLRTASHCASAKGQLRMLKLLKQFGASFEIQNYRGDLPIHEAVQAGSKEVVEWLLDLHPSSLDACSHEGRTGLHLAAATGNIEMVVFLCSNKCEVNPLMLYRDSLYTPLDLAKRKDHKVVIDYLAVRHHALEAEQMPEEERKNYKTHFEERMINAKLARGKVLRQESSSDSQRKIRRRLTSSEMHIKETQTSSPHKQAAGTNTTGGKRATSAQSSGRQLPKATSTSDLLEKKDKFDDRIERILQDEIRKAMERGEDESEVDGRRRHTNGRGKSGKRITKTASGQVESSSDDEHHVIMRRKVKTQGAEKSGKASEGDDSTAPEHEIDESLLGKSISDSSEEEEKGKSSKENHRPAGSRPMTAKTRQGVARKSPAKQPSQSSLKKSDSSVIKTKAVRLNTGDKDESQEDSDIDEISNEKGGKVLMSKNRFDAAKTHYPRPTIVKKTKLTKKSKKSGKLTNNNALCVCNTGKVLEFNQYLEHFMRLSPAWKMPGLRVRREPEIGDDGGDYDIYEDEWEEMGETERPTGKDARRRYVHEKAIFQELTHLKRMQIQYGKVQEKVLVRSLIGNFCKMHGLNPADFKFFTFYAWEKFLYDQLKMIYMEERERLQTAGITSNKTANRLNRFETRLKQARAVPLNDKIRELTRVYGNGSMTAGKTAQRRRPHDEDDKEKQLSITCNPGGGKRCDCFGRHLLIKQDT